jgi:hypothetical protein
MHDGRADPGAGGRARAAKLRKEREAAEERGILARMGTRAVIASALQDKHAEVRRAVHLLADAAGDGDLQAAKALIPWLNQGLGMPTERHELAVPASRDEIAQLSDEQLEAIVREGSRARLQALPEPD